MPETNAETMLRVVLARREQVKLRTPDPEAVRKNAAVVAGIALATAIIVFAP